MSRSKDIAKKTISTGFHEDKKHLKKLNKSVPEIFNYSCLVQQDKHSFLDVSADYHLSLCEFHPNPFSRFGKIENFHSNFRIFDNSALNPTISTMDILAEPYGDTGLVDSCSYSKITRTELLNYKAIITKTVRKQQKLPPTKCMKENSTSWFSSELDRRKFLCADSDTCKELPITGSIKERICRIFGSKKPSPNRSEKQDHYYEVPEKFTSYLLPNNCGFERASTKSKKPDHKAKGRKHNLNIKKHIFLHKAVQTSKQTENSLDASAINGSASNSDDERLTKYDLEFDDLEFYNFLDKLNNDDSDENSLISKKISLLDLLMYDEEKRLKNAIRLIQMRENTIQGFIESQYASLLDKKLFITKQKMASLQLQDECVNMQKTKMKFITVSEKRQNALMETKRKFEQKIALLQNNQVSETEKYKQEWASQKTKVDVSIGCKVQKTIDRPNSPILMPDTNVQCYEYINCNGSYLNFLFKEAKLPQIFKCNKKYVVNREALKKLRFGDTYQNNVTSVMPTKRMKGQFTETHNRICNSLPRDNFLIGKKSVVQVCSMMYIVHNKNNVDKFNLDSLTRNEAPNLISFPEVKLNKLSGPDLTGGNIDQQSVLLAMKNFADNSLNTRLLPKKSLELEVSQTKLKTQFTSQGPKKPSIMTLTPYEANLHKSTSGNIDMMTDRWGNIDSQMMPNTGLDEKINYLCGDYNEERPCNGLLCLMSRSSKEFDQELMQNKSNFMMKLTVSPNLVVEKAGKALAEFFNDLPSSKNQSSNALSQWQNDTPVHVAEDRSCLLQDFETIFQKVLAQTIEEYRRTVKED